MARLIHPTGGYIHDTHTDIQRAFIEKIEELGTEAALEWLKPIKGELERTHPEPLKALWEADGAGEYTVELFPAECPEERTVYKTPECHLNIYNLIPDKEYRVSVSGGESVSFKTAPAKIRFIKLDDALNVRDIGGGKIKEGLVFRGSALDGKYAITEEGKETFTKELKIRTDLELRGEAIGKCTVSPAGEGVQLITLPYRPYLEIFQERHLLGICKIMELLSHKDAYPIYIHCRGGADRTGMIALFLRALMGEDDEVIHLDYELTALSTYAAGEAEGADGFRSRNASYYRAFLEGLDTYAPGEGLSVSVPRFLTSAGVPEETLEKIRSILKK